MKKITLTLLLFISVTALFAQTEKEKVQATVNKSTIEGHIYFLADDLLKGRETGTPENKIAASYLANTLRGYGVKSVSKTGSYYQEVPLQKVTPPKKITLKLDGLGLEQLVALEAPKMEFVGDAVYMGYGLEDDYKGKVIKKQLVVIKAGSEDAKDARAAFRLRDEKMRLAKKAGALGIIELVQTDSNIWNFIDHNFNSTQIKVANSNTLKEDKENNFAYIWAFDENGNYAKDFSAKGALTKGVLKTTLAMSGGETEIIASQNVIGIVEGTDPILKNEYIIYSAHYDHVGLGTPNESGDFIYNGARDNAVGTTTVLSMAENLVKYPTKRSALFILFTGEEKGLLGSEYYINNPVLPLSQMVYCFNSDNAGYNDTSLATIIGLNRTSAAQNIKDAATTFGLTANDDPAPEEGLFDRSDNVHFAAKGIPSPTFSLGFTAFNGTVTEYYHRPGDEANTLDYNYLLKFFQAYVLAGRKIANDVNTPFWTSGDKYEEVGKKLYNK